MVEFFLFLRRKKIFTRNSANLKKKFTKLHFSVEFSMERLVNYGVNPKKKRTLIDDQKYEYNSASENARKQKQRNIRILGLKT